MTLDNDPETDSYLQVVTRSLFGPTKVIVHRDRSVLYIVKSSLSRLYLYLYKDYSDQRNFDFPI